MMTRPSYFKKPSMLVEVPTKSASNTNFMENGKWMGKQERPLNPDLRDLTGSIEDLRELMETLRKWPEPSET